MDSTFVDDFIARGRGRPRRVVSLVPSVTGTLFDLGLGETVAGVTDYCVYPAERVAALPKVGGTKNPDLDCIQSLAPDLIIANQEENRQEDVEALQAAGFAVWVTFPRTMRQALDLLWETIRLFEAPRLGPTLDALERSFEWTCLAAQNQVPVKVFCPIWREPAAEAGPPAWWMTINADTYVHDVLKVCGGDNIFAERERRYPLAADLDASAPAAAAPGRDTRYPRVSPAEVAAGAPEVILLPSEPYLFTEADWAAFDDYAAIPAVSAGRIHLVDGSLLTWPGTRLAQALAELPALLNPIPSVTG